MSYNANMKFLFLISAFLFFLNQTTMASAADVTVPTTNIKMQFNNEEITKVIELYSKATSQKFIVDPSVRGKISIFNPVDVTATEAFNQLSTALALNGFAISKENDTLVVRSARNIQRSLIEVSSQLPSIKPERMYTYVIQLKHVPVQNINRDLRIIPSKDGEMTVLASTNQMIITDWVTNLNRVAEIIKLVDRPTDPAVAKIVDKAAKEFRMDRGLKGNKEDKDGGREVHPPRKGTMPGFPEDHSQ